jgi:hypothetical protein
MERYRIELDRSAQVLGIELPEDHGFGRFRKAADPELSPSIPEGHGFVSASALAEKAKQLDDGLYAAVDRAAQAGLGRFPGKTALLRALASQLAAAPPSAPAAVVLAAARLGGHAAPLDGPMRRLVEALLDTFQADALRSKPIGFYTWSSELEAIFRQDRMLQTELEDEAGIESVRTALRSNPALLASYEAMLTLAARLTNPLVLPDLRAARLPCAFFPASYSHETDLAKRLFRDRPIPEGYDLVRDLMNRVAGGTLDLTPRSESGWYDLQTWALEPLLRPDAMPEAPRLEMGWRYRAQLRDLFQGLLARTRETHVKQFEGPFLGVADTDPLERRTGIAPQLAVEPLAAFYLRRALSYRFVRAVLENAFGAPALRELRRLTARGPVEASLEEELSQIEALFLDAHTAVRDELGMAPDAAAAGRDPKEARARIASFAAGVARDPDLGQDGRMMVPLFFDLERRKTKVLAFFGWASHHAEVRYSSPPGVRVFERSGRELPAGEARVEFGSLHASLAYPVTAEVYVGRILDRARFQRHCDRHRTAPAILAALD